MASLAQGWENVTVNDPAAQFYDAGAAGPLTLQVENLQTGTVQRLDLLCTDVFDYYDSGGTYTLGLLSDTVHDR